MYAEMINIDWAIKSMYMSSDHWLRWRGQCRLCPKTPVRMLGNSGIKSTGRGAHVLRCRLCTMKFIYQSSSHSLRDFVFINKMGSCKLNDKQSLKGCWKNVQKVRYLVLFSVSQTDTQSKGVQNNNRFSSLKQV